MTLNNSSNDNSCACYPSDTWQKILRDPSAQCVRCGDAPIHIALTYRAPDEVITTILGAFPEGARRKDHAGSLPLWSSIVGKYSDEVIMALLQNYPEAAEKQMKNGVLPLHQVIEDGFSCGVILSTLHAFPMAAKKPDHTGEYPFLAALNKRCSDKVILELLRANTDAARSELASIGDLPLHQAIKKGYSDEVIISILHAFPQAAKELDHTGITPLISSIRQKCPDKIVLALLKVNPCAAKKLDDDLPLHQAIKMNYSEEVILAILNEYPEACQEKCSNGNLPLNMAIEVNSTDKVVFSLLDAYAGGSWHENNVGELPLHQALRKGFSEEVILRIFHEYPCATMVRCKKSSMLPLHIAASSSSSPCIVETLIREYPYALEKVVNGATPSDLVSSSLPVESVKMICQPVSYWSELNSREVHQSDAIKISSMLSRMEDTLSDLRDTLGNVNAKIDAVHYRLHQVESKVNKFSISKPGLTANPESTHSDSCHSLTMGTINEVFVAECNSAITIGREGTSTGKLARATSELSSGSASKALYNTRDLFVDEDKENKLRVKALRERLEKKLVIGGVGDNESGMSCVLQESYRVTGASKIAFKYLTDRSSSGGTSTQYKKLAD